MRSNETLFRRFVLDDTEQFQGGQKRDEEVEFSASHFTCFTNIGCQNHDVAVYETFETFRNQKNILTTEGRKLLRLLLKREDGHIIKGKVIDVAIQEESGKIKHNKVF